MAAGFGVFLASQPFFPELPLFGAALFEALLKTLFETLLEALFAGGGYALAASFFEPFLDVVGEYHCYRLALGGGSVKGWPRDSASRRRVFDADQASLASVQSPALLKTLVRDLAPDPCSRAAAMRLRRLSSSHFWMSWASTMNVLPDSTSAKAVMAAVVPVGARPMKMPVTVPIISLSARISPAMMKAAPVMNRMRKMPKYQRRRLATMLQMVSLGWCPGCGQLRCGGGEWIPAFAGTGFCGVGLGLRGLGDSMGFGLRVVLGR